MLGAAATVADYNGVAKASHIKARGDAGFGVAGEAEKLWKQKGEIMDSSFFCICFLGIIEMDNIKLDKLR